MFLCSEADHVRQQYARESLRKACKYGNLVVVRRVLESHLVELDAALSYGKTPLMIAARHGKRVPLPSAPLC